MKSEILSKEKNENYIFQKNYYFLKYNETLSSYISNEIDLYRKDKRKEIFQNSIFFNEELLYLIFISYSKEKYYLIVIELTSQGNKTKEIELIISIKNFFELGNIELSKDEKHLVLLNREKTKLFIIFNYAKEIEMKEKIILENYYENTENTIKDIKFNNTPSKNRENLLLNEDIILYGINCTYNNLSLFSNKFLNREFQINFNEPFIDFQIVKNDMGGEDLYIMNSFGNFKYLKNINDIKNIPKSDESQFFQKIKIYNKIAYNINNYQKNIKNEFIKFYFQVQSNVDKKMDKFKSMINVIRCTKRVIDISILTGDKIFVIKRYCLDEEEECGNNEENISKIFPINNICNVFIIKSNKNIYLLDVPNLVNIGLISNWKGNENVEKKKQEVLIEINEIISKTNLSIVLKLSTSKNNIPSIIYNFYRSNILCIKKIKNNFIIRIYDFEQDDQKLYQNKKNNFIIYEKSKNQKEKEDYLIIMENLLKNIKIEIEHLKEKDLNSMNKNEYIKKILEEFSSKINEILISDNNHNINIYINQINEYYQNLFMSILLYGQKIKNEDDSIKYFLARRNQFEKDLKNQDENIDKIKKRVDDKLQKIKENQNKIIQLRNENHNMMYQNYLNNLNSNNEGKEFSNELIKRTNNFALKNIKFLEENIKFNGNHENVNFEKIQNFNLTMKYLNESQKRDIHHIIDLIQKLYEVLKQFKNKFQKVENE